MVVPDKLNGRPQILYVSAKWTGGRRVPILSSSMDTRFHTTCTFIDVWLDAINYTWKLLLTLVKINSIRAWDMHCWLLVVTKYVPWDWLKLECQFDFVLLSLLCHNIKEKLNLHKIMNKIADQSFLWQWFRIT